MLVSSIKSLCISAIILAPSVFSFLVSSRSELNFSATKPPSRTNSGGSGTIAFSSVKVIS